MISWHHTWRELLSHKIRVLLTVLAIAWGTVSIACMLAIGEGLRGTFSHATNDLGAPALVLTPGASTKPYRGLKSGEPTLLDKMDVKLLRTQVSGINQIIAMNDLMASMSYHGNSTSGNMLAIPPDYNHIYPLKLLKGSRFFNPLDMKLANHVVVLGQYFVDGLFGKQVNPIGKVIKLNGQSFKVIGVIPKVKAFTVGGMPNYYLSFMPSTTYRLLAQSYHYSKLIIVPKSGVNTEKLEAKVREVIAFHHHLDPTDAGVISFSNQSQAQNTFNNFMWGLQLFLGIIGAITLVIAGVGVANVMFASINQSLRDIGVRIALGAKSYHIVLHYLFESVLVTLSGGMIGVLLSYFIVFVLRRIPLHSTYFKQFGSPYPILSIGVIVTVITVLGIVGFLAGFFPAKRAAQIDPVEALRHE